MTAPNGGDALHPYLEMEYGYSTDDSAPSAWQGGLVFSGLSPNTTYYFFARYKADPNKNNASAASPSFMVTTDLTTPTNAIFSVTNTDKTYNAAAQGATVGYDGDIDTTKAGTIKVYYNGSETVPINAGTYAITVTTTGGSVYSAITTPTLIGTLTINKAGQSALTITGGNITKTYGNSAFNLATVGGNGTGAVTYTVIGGTDVVSINGNTVTILKAGTATVTATKADDDNYNSITSASITITVDKATPSYTTPSGLSAIYGDTLSKITLPTGFSWESSLGTSVGAAGNKSFTVKYTPSDTNYKEVTGISVIVNVIQKTLTISVTQPTGTLTPLEPTCMFDVTVNGLVGSDKITIGLATNGFGLSVSNNTGVGSSKQPITLNYKDTVTVNTLNTVGTQLTLSNANYILYNPPIVTVKIIDGQDIERAIPVNQANVAAFNTYANTENGTKRHYKQTTDITLSPSGNNWTAIGNNFPLIDFPFIGSYNGGDCKITNLTVNAGMDQGMFCWIGSAGVVKNVTLEGGRVTGSGYVGGVAGGNYGRVENCHTTGDVMGATNTNDCVGGVVGENFGTVENCHTTGDVTGTTGTSNYVGGVVGSNKGAVQNCYTTGSIKGTAAVGGVVGDNSGTVQNCYAAGSVSASRYVGGVVGYNNGTVQNCYAAESVSASEHDAGGVVGYNNSTVQNCYAAGSVSASAYVGGVVGDNSATVRNCVALNPSVTASNSTSYIGRVTGNPTGVRFNNYAYSDMTVTNGSGTSAPNISLTSKDGANLSAADAKTVTSWNNINKWYVTPPAFTWNFTNTWVWKDGYMPSLKGVGTAQEWVSPLSAGFAMPFTIETPIPPMSTSAANPIESSHTNTIDTIDTIDKTVTTDIQTLSAQSAFLAAPLSIDTTLIHAASISATEPTVGYLAENSYYINAVYANGTPITIKKDADGKAKIYKDSDLSTPLELFDTPAYSDKSALPEYCAVYGGSENDDYTGNTSVTIESGEIKNNIYGGGKNGNVTGDTSVTIKPAAIINASVYGGGENGAVSGTATVVVDGATVNNAVFGGGYNATVNNTAIEVKDGAMVSFVFGGGKNASDGSTVVTVRDCTVGEVYGGGENSSVSGIATVNIYPETVIIGSKSKDCKTHGTTGIGSAIVYWHKVIYDLNTGTGTAPVIIDYVAAGTNAFTAANADDITPPTGMLFRNWNTAANGTGVSYAIGAPVAISAPLTHPYGDFTLYAIYDTAINSAGISVTAPVTGATPDLTATGTGDFSISDVSWNPISTKFLGGTQYEATVTLTANEGFTFAEFTGGTINGETATVSNHTEAVTLSYEFSATSTATAASIKEIKAAPELSYTHGEALDLSALKITVIFNDDTETEITFAELASYGIATSLSSGIALSKIAHDSQALTLTCNEIATSIGTLQIAKADTVLTLEANPASTAVYGENNVTLTAVAAKHLNGDVPSGVVTFKDGENVIGTGTLDSSGKCQITITLGGGERSLKVEYNGDGNYNLAISAPINYTVGKANQAELAVTNISGTITYGDTFTVSASGGSVADGALSYSTSNTNIATVNSSGEVTVTGVGNFTITATKAGNTNYNDVSTTSAMLTANPKPVTISGVAVDNKLYDKTIVAAITSSGAINGIINNDNVSVVNGSANFNTAGVGTDKTVTFSGFSLGGADHTKYALLEQPTSVKADITKNVLTVDVSVSDKVYNGTNAASYAVPPTLKGVIAGDIVTLSNGTPTFSSVNIAENIAIDFDAPFSISGTDAGNYTLTQPSNITASIRSGFTPGKNTHYTLNIADGDNGWFVAKSFTITAESGYSLSESNSASGVWASELIYGDETTGTNVTFYVKNNSANEISAPKTESYKKDATPPTITVSGNPTKPVQSATLNINTSSGISGIKSVSVSKNNGLAETISTGNYTVTENAAYKFTVTNNAGAKAEKIVDVTNIDSDKPVAAINANGYIGGTWTNQNVTLSVSNTGVNLGAITFEYNLNSSGWQAYSSPLSIDAEGAYIYIFRGTSSSGLVSDESNIEVKIDKTAPVISGITNAQIYCEAKTVTVSDANLDSVTVNGNSAGASFILSSASGIQTVIATDKAGNKTTVTVTVNQGHTWGNWQTVTPPVCTATGTEEHLCSICSAQETQLIPALGHDWDNGAISKEATHFENGEILYTCKHDSSHTRTEVIPMLNDSDAPEIEIKAGNSVWRSLLHVITFGVFFKDTQVITITATDVGSGIDKAYYYKSAVALSAEEVKELADSNWIEGTSFSALPGESFVVYVKATDKSGNTSYASTDGIVIDATVPVIGGVTDGGNYCDAQTVTVTEEYLDTVTVNDMPITLTDGSFTLNPSENAQTVTATDKAGNAVSVTVTINNSHTWGEWQTDTAPTCTDMGLEKRFCTVCGDYEAQAIPALGHTYDSGTVKEPTCQEYGEILFVCAHDAAHNYTETIDKLQHQLIEKFTEDTHYFECTVCHETFDSIPHYHTWGAWVVTAIPTCTTVGEEKQVCADCGTEETRQIPATGHSFGAWTEVTGSTCTEKGLEKRVCSASGTEETREVEALGHGYGTEWVIDIPANCTTVGSKSYHCLRCGDKKDITEIPPTGHSFGAWIQITAPACTEKGLEKRVCTINGTEETREIPATGHSFGEWYIYKAPTSETEGERRRDCIAGDTFESHVINKTEVKVVGKEESEPTVDVKTENLDKAVDITEDLKKGNTVSVHLEIIDISDTIPTVEKEKIIQELQGSEAEAIFLDVSLFTVVTDSSSGNTEKIQHNDSTELITVTLTIPEELRGKKSYTIIRVHEDEVARLETLYDPENHTLTFQTDRFSTYAIAVEDEEDTSDNGNNSENNGGNNNSNSGSNNSGSSYRPPQSTTTTSTTPKVTEWNCQYQLTKINTRK